MSKPIIVVFGATGKTGSGAIDYILNDPDKKFVARAVTRNPDGDAAKAIKARGVEVVQADLGDTASLVKALTGAYGVLGVTDFWTAFEEERTHGKNLVDAAKQAGIKHFVWTTLDGYDRDHPQFDELQIPHWQTKYDVEKYLEKSGVPFTALYLSWFLENIASPFFNVERTADGKVQINTEYASDGQLPVIAASDIGGWALEAFKNPQVWLGKQLKVATEWVTPDELAIILSEVIGEPVTTVPFPLEQFYKQDTISGSNELWRNMRWFYENSPNGSPFAKNGPGRDVELSLRLLPNAKKTRDFVKQAGASVIKDNSKK